MTFIEVFNLFTKFFVITAAGAAQYGTFSVAPATPKKRG